MNRAELVESVAKITDQPKSEVSRTLSALIHTVTSVLSKGDKVTLVGFGTFERRQRKARTGRNPRTLDPLKIPAAKVPASAQEKSSRTSLMVAPSKLVFRSQSRKLLLKPTRKLLLNQLLRKLLLSQLLKRQQRKPLRKDSWLDARKLGEIRLETIPIPTLKDPRLFLGFFVFALQCLISFSRQPSASPYGIH